jgi:serine protease Do
MRLMRIDTAVNGGNSGGGLFNERGEVIGIVNAKIVSSTIDNIGYAIPSNVARLIAENIIHYENTGSECAKRSTIGITLSADTNSHTIYDTETGKVHIIEEVVIAEITKNSLVEGKLQLGDIITSIKIGDGEALAVTRNFNVVERMLAARAGDTVVFEIIRNGSAISVSIEITADCVVDIV